MDEDCAIEAHQRFTKGEVYCSEKIETIDLERRIIFQSQPEDDRARFRYARLIDDSERGSIVSK